MIAPLTSARITSQDLSRNVTTLWCEMQARSAIWSAGGLDEVARRNESRFHSDGTGSFFDCDAFSTVNRVHFT
jgi:hypothetical protein